MPKARKESDSNLLFADGYILRIRVWEVEAPVHPSGHRFKYSCFYGRPGERVVLYDNERGKGDHRHYGTYEESYAFQSIETLIADFLADVRRFRGGGDMSKVEVHVGEAMEDVAARAIDAWHRIERGEAVSERHVSFETWETMVRVLSPKRLELLRHLHRTPAKNIRALAVALHRDYRRVHEDVEALGAAGLLNRDKDGVRAEYEAFDVAMRVAL